MTKNVIKSWKKWALHFTFYDNLRVCTVVIWTQFLYNVIPSRMHSLATLAWWWSRKQNTGQFIWRCLPIIFQPIQRIFSALWRPSWRDPSPSGRRSSWSFSTRWLSRTGSTAVAVMSSCSPAPRTSTCVSWQTRPRTPSCSGRTSAAATPSSTWSSAMFIPRLGPLKRSTAKKLKGRAGEYLRRSSKTKRWLI